MKIIPPHQISSEIINLIHDANEYLILVSPFVNFHNWEGIKTELLNAVKRNVIIKFYTRLDNENSKSWDQIEALGLEPKLIKNLHSKVYFNEKSGIVTSMNLLTSSSLNAIEFGALYNTKEEMDELKHFVKRYLEPNVATEKPNDEDLYLVKEKFQIIIQNYLSHYLQRGVTCRWKNGCLEIQSSNQFILSIEKVKNVFTISGVVSGTESEEFETFVSRSKLEEVDLLFYGERGSMSSFHAVIRKKLSNSNFDYITVTEKKLLLEISFTFISELTSFKEDCYKNRKAIC